MDLVLLVGVGVVGALVAGVSARRAVLGQRMDDSFEALKVSARQSVSPPDVVMHRAPVRVTVSKAVLHGHSPIANTGEPQAEVIRASARRAS